jgi:hypothetical protein
MISRRNRSRQLSASRLAEHSGLQSSDSHKTYFNMPILYYIQICGTTSSDPHDIHSFSDLKTLQCIGKISHLHEKCIKLQDL